MLITILASRNDTDGFKKGDYVSSVLSYKKTFEKEIIGEKIIKIIDSKHVALRDKPCLDIRWLMHAEIETCDKCKGRGYSIRR
jgi:hypothetical protein